MSNKENNTQENLGSVGDAFERQYSKLGIKFDQVKTKAEAIKFSYLVNESGDTATIKLAEDQDQHLGLIASYLKEGTDPKVVGEVLSAIDLAQNTLRYAVTEEAVSIFKQNPDVKQIHTDTIYFGNTHNEPSSSYRIDREKKGVSGIGGEVKEWSVPLSTSVTMSMGKTNPNKGLGKLITSVYRTQGEDLLK